MDKGERGVPRPHTGVVTKVRTVSDLELRRMLPTCDIPVTITRTRHINTNQRKRTMDFISAFNVTSLSHVTTLL